MRRALLILAGAIVFFTVTFIMVANRDVDISDDAEEIDSLQTGAEYYGCESDQGAWIGVDGVECLPMDEWQERVDNQ